MKDVTISIPDMQSTHCQARVRTAVKQVAGVQVQNLEAGKLTVSLASEDLIDDVASTITKAGYTVSPEAAMNTSSCTTGCCTH